MGTKMTHSARVELTNAVRRRYSAAAGAEKRKILDEFIAVTSYHEKSAIRALNAEPTVKRRQTRVRPSLYDDAVRAALIVLLEASDRVCGKRLRALLPILLLAERNGHLHLAEPLRQKILAMSASTIDRLLRVPRSARLKKALRAMPAARRRVPVRTFADWNEPPPGSIQMDLVAHCGEANRGSYVHSLVLTDIASGWTEAAPLMVRESGLVVETLDRVRQGLPFALFDALIRLGDIDLATALAAAQKLYGQAFNPEVTLKALSYFDDGNLSELPNDLRLRLVTAVREVDLDHLPDLGSASRRDDLGSEL